MPPLPQTLETPRLVLRHWADDDIHAVAAMNADAEVMRHFPALLDGAQSRAQVEGWRTQAAARGLAPWAARRRDDGSFVGCIGLAVPRHALPFDPGVEIVWRLVRRAWGQGLATEGALACLRLGFEALGLDEIVATTARSNRRSIAVMQRIGLLDAGIVYEHPGLPEAHPLRPHVLYRLTRAQWQEAHGPLAPGAERV